MIKGEGVCNGWIAMEVVPSGPRSTASFLLLILGTRALRAET